MARMAWRIGFWYFRRDGNRAMFEGLSFGMPVFYHPDLSTKCMPKGIIAHEWDGKVSASKSLRPWCRTHDIITDVLDAPPAPCEPL